MQKRTVNLGLFPRLTQRQQLKLYLHWNYVLIKNLFERAGKEMDDYYEAMLEYKKMKREKCQTITP